MILKQYQRVSYEKNPLVEVVCQFSFPKMDVSNGLEHFRKVVASMGYSKFEEKKAASFVVKEPPLDGGNLGRPVSQVEYSKVFSFSSFEDGRKILISSEFFEITTSRYLRWEDFRASVMEVAGIFFDVFSLRSIDKISLRYKDVIEREALALDGVAWRELLAPFVVGMLDADIFEEGYSASDFVQQQNSQTLLTLPTCKVLLQSALLHSMSTSKQQAFLIDSDFFCEHPSVNLAHSAELQKMLDLLHDDAGALFRVCILGRLHDALCPNAI